MKIGAKIILIDDDWSDCVDHPVFNMQELPTKGVIYTVRGFHVDFNPIEVSVRLEEIVNPVCRWYNMKRDVFLEGEVAFRKSRFRVVDSDQIYKEYDFDMEAIHEETLLEPVQ